MADSILRSVFVVARTRKFSVFNSVYDAKLKQCKKQNIILDVNCEYSSAIVVATILRRPWCTIIDDTDETTDKSICPLFIGDFENIDWEVVLAGKCSASSYLVRKGLSRKAQLSLQLKRYISKHPNSVLKQAVPYTVILETWNAFEEMKLDFGRGTFASFDCPALTQAPLRQKLDWCLSDARSVVEEDEEMKDWHWILKPSVTNKGSDISIARDWNDVLDAVEAVPDIREWVLQRYLADPLLVDGYKFHLRVYVLCVGALRVFVFDDILMLLAAHRYELSDLTDIHKHLTNTARSAEDVNFDEKLFVKLLDDLPFYLHKQKPDQYPSLTHAQAAVTSIRQNIHAITSDLFAAYENEYSVFCPMANCYELYGLDFMVDNDMKVSLLEVNPGPDFKQTGDRLRKVIVGLYEQMAAIVIDTNLVMPVNYGREKGDKQELSLSHTETDSKYAEVWKETATDFTLVYSKEWSVSSLKGGMSLK